ncbi:MAG: hypothetical protein V1774_12380 [Candidatus Eisenbacteria bacterium]
MGNEEDLVRHLRTVTGLEIEVLEKILNEVKSWFAEDLKTWVVRRHAELRRQGLRNREIYTRIGEEAGEMFIRPTSLSERQIRRMIYG